MLGAGHHQAQRHHQTPATLEGQYTSTIYSYIKSRRYASAVQILHSELQRFPQSRAALSLLGFCFFHSRNYPSAVTAYEALLQLYPGVEEYRMVYAQALYNAGLYPEAMRACMRVEGSQYTQRKLMLQSAIKYEMDELPASKSLLDQCALDEPEAVVNLAAISFKEGNFEGAREKYIEALNTLGYQADLAYNIALCSYQLKQFGPALKYIAEIIDRGVQEHPELSVGSNADGIEVRSVGNSPVLQETYLIEAFNLKAAIDFSLKNMELAKEALSDMPPRLEEELDPVTLHNQAIIHMAEDPRTGFNKLNFLLMHPPFPPETIGNLVVLHCQHQFYDLAADMLAQYAGTAHSFLPPELYKYLEATILSGTSPEEAYRKYDDLTNKHIDQLRKLTKAIQDARFKLDNEAIKQALRDYDEGLERYIPVLMAMARIYWDRQNYSMVEKLFRQSAEFCSEHEVWKLNVAHVFFIQDSKWKESIRYYDPIVRKNGGEQLLNVPAIVLANLCVSYIMTSQNEAAEELMRKIEKEEERLEFPEQRSVQHLCIVNLVIGTLYCAKSNFEFGIARIVKSLEPYDRKLSAETWYYAKRCFLALAENMAKHLVTLKDTSFHEVFEFLDAVELHGNKMKAVSATATLGSKDGAACCGKRATFSGRPSTGKTHNTISYEARQLKFLFIRLME